MDLQLQQTCQSVPTIVVLDQQQNLDNKSLCTSTEKVLKLEKENYEGKAGLHLWLEHKYIVLTLAEASDLNAIQKQIRAAVKLALKEKWYDIQFVLLSEQVHDNLTQTLQAIALADYEFDDYIDTGIKPIKQDDTDTTDDKKCKPRLNKVGIIVECKKAEEKLAEALNLSEIILLARDLVNQPANKLTPEVLAERAQSAAAEYGFEIEVFGPDKIVELGMDAYWSVAKGSDQEPRFLVMKYEGAPESDKLLALVGKGITYDSGGYAIKPATGMVTMHCDMGGSAAVIGAISALAKARAKVNVVSVVAACENLISGHAYKNGDIIGSLSGKSIEVVNTDAEGRLTLADAVCYADRYLNATHIIDIATLTGACIIALGDEYTAVLADDEEMWSSAEAAGKFSGDKVWRMPCDEAFAEQNKSPRADIKNTGGRPAGTVTAGMFVRAFAGGKPWMHFDIAASAYNDKDTGRQPAGATGCGVELLYRIALDLFK